MAVANALPVVGCTVQLMRGTSKACLVKTRSAVLGCLGVLGGVYLGLVIVGW